ncbi:MAG: SRPBCC family protein [Gemmatimonadales bacterium]
MKWVLIVIGGLVALLALLALVGAFIAREHVATSSTVVRQPPDTVWKVISDLGSVPQWWTEVTASERLPDREGKPVWRQKSGGWDMPLVVEESEPGRRLVTRIDTPPGAAFGGTWTYELQPMEGGAATRVTITEGGFVGNPVFRVMVKFVWGYYNTQDKYLVALGRKFGQTVTPAHH